MDWVERNRPEHYEAVLATIWAVEIPEFADNTKENYTLPFPQEVLQTNWITAQTIEFLHEGGEMIDLAKGEMKYLSTEVAGGFTGVYFGVYATGNGRAAGAPADFNWFDYRSESSL